METNKSKRQITLESGVSSAHSRILAFGGVISTKLFCVLL